MGEDIKNKVIALANSLIEKPKESPIKLKLEKTTRIVGYSSNRNSFRRNSIKKAGIIISVIVVFVIVILPFLGNTKPTEKESFSINVFDGVTGNDISQNEFNYEIYGTFQDDLENIINDEIYFLKNGTNINEIKENDLISSYKYHLMMIGGGGYYDRWFLVFREVSNRLFLYRAPYNADVQVISNSKLIEPKNVNGDFSINVVINEDTGYSSTPFLHIYEDFLNSMYFLVEFNDTVNLLTLKSKDVYEILRYNESTLIYLISYLWLNERTFEFEWNVSPNCTCANNVILNFRNETLFNSR